MLDAVTPELTKAIDSHIKSPTTTNDDLLSNLTHLAHTTAHKLLPTSLSKTIFDTTMSYDAHDPHCAMVHSAFLDARTSENSDIALVGVCGSNNEQFVVDSVSQIESKIKR